MTAAVVIDDWVRKVRRSSLLMQMVEDDDDDDVNVSGAVDVAGERKAWLAVMLVRRAASVSFIVKYLCIGSITISVNWLRLIWHGHFVSLRCV